MAKTKFIEALEEQYTKKDAKSVLRYKAPDGKWRYIQTSKDASGGDTPTPTPTPIPSGGGMEEVTWQELKGKRDAGELTPGSLYRITDYQCTTTQENTQSAGHQFDIVLLALSANKLAEEGWAMMHESNIYDVVFNDGTIEKCYVYEYEQGQYNIVRTDNLLGQDVADEGHFDGEEFTAGDYSYNDLTNEGLTYNYFQNSNLSAWKVWYCLDNDTARFAWADDRLILHQIMISGSPQDYIRTPESDSTIDGVKYYAWVWASSPEFTLSETPKHGDAVYKNLGGMQEIGECDKVFTNGRGVIYRLIDEFNNDCPYDFKNVQYVRKLTDGAYDAQGTDTWCYTLNYWDAENSISKDITLMSNTLLNDEGAIAGVCNNKIEPITGSRIYYMLIGQFALPNNVFLGYLDYNVFYGINDNYISDSCSLTIDCCTHCKFLSASSRVFRLCTSIIVLSEFGGSQIYENFENKIFILGKKVLTEE